jgi:hypothetical protein
LLAVATSAGYRTPHLADERFREPRASKPDERNGDDGLVRPVVDSGPRKRLLRSAMIGCRYLQLVGVRSECFMRAQVLAVI